MSKEQNVTNLIALLMFILSEEIVEFTQIELKIIILIIGVLIGFGYSIPSIKEILLVIKSKITKKSEIPVPKEETPEIPVKEIHLDNE